MIGGCQRRMYYVRDTGSRLFREAYFVLREGAGVAAAEGDLAAEADRILRERFPGRRRRRIPGKWAVFAAGAIIGTAVGMAVMGLIMG